MDMITAFAPNRAARLVMSTALAAGVLTGCASGGAHPDKYASSAQAALAKGTTTAAIDNAEKAVLADPRNASDRCLRDAIAAAGARHHEAFLKTALAAKAALPDPGPDVIRIVARHHAT